MTKTEQAKQEAGASSQDVLATIDRMEATLQDLIKLQQAAKRPGSIPAQRAQEVSEAIANTKQDILNARAQRTTEQALKEDLASMKDIKEKYEALLKRTAEESSRRAQMIREQQKQIKELGRNCRQARWINEKLQETIDQLNEKHPSPPEVFRKEVIALLEKRRDRCLTIEKREELIEEIGEAKATPDIMAWWNNR